MSVADLRKTVFNVLKPPEIYEIKFRCAGSGIFVDPLGFVEVMYEAFGFNGGGNIDIIIDPARVEKAHAGALYSKRDRAFVFSEYSYGMKGPRIITEKSAIIHECVHAMQHIRRHRHSYFQEEAAAYIAQNLWIRHYTGMSAEKFYWNRTLSPIEAEADKIGAKIVGNMNAVVDLPDLANLIPVIQADPTYADIDGDPPARNDNGGFGLY